jgi:hypothetical protein
MTHRTLTPKGWAKEYRPKGFLGRHILPERTGNLYCGLGDYPAMQVNFSNFEDGSLASATYDLYKAGVLDTADAVIDLVSGTYVIIPNQSVSNLTALGIPDQEDWRYDLKATLSDGSIIEVPVVLRGIPNRQYYIAQKNGEILNWSIDLVNIFESLDFDVLYTPTTASIDDSSGVTLTNTVLPTYPTTALTVTVEKTAATGYIDIKVLSATADPRYAFRVFRVNLTE